MLGGDGRIDIYVDNPGALALTVPDNLAASPTTSYIELDGSQELAMQQHTIAHELFHVIQLSIWQPLPFPAHLPDYWLLEGSAEWMGFRVDHYDPSFGIDLGPTDMALDCRDPLGNNMCDLTDDYKNNGYSRWPFFEYLAEKYGATFIRDIFTQGAAGAPAVTSMTAISNALAAKGTTLADTYNAWTQADLIGGYSISTLQGKPPTPYGAWPTGLKGGALGTTLVPVNHLSTRIVEFTAATATQPLVLRRDAQPHRRHAGGHALEAGLLVERAGQLARAAHRQRQHRLGDAAVGHVHVRRVEGATSRSRTPRVTSIVDAADFAVSATMSVDPAKLATLGASRPSTRCRLLSSRSTAVDAAPTLTLFGPEILKLSAGQTLLRLIVESNGQGSVRGKLGAFDLGSVAIRGGNNDVRFKLPKSVLNALRRSAASGSNVLTLTPVAATGGATGSPVTARCGSHRPRRRPKHK